MDILIAALIVLAAWFIFKSIVIVILVLVAMAIALAIVRRLR